MRQRLYSLAVLVTLIALLAGGEARAAGKVKTGYPFTKPPAEALEVLARLKRLTIGDFAFTADEVALFADAKDGRLDQHSFAEAALIASAVTDAAKRKAYLARIDALEAEARKVTADAKTPYEKGDKLLRWLHSKEGPMANGYKTEQTDLAVLLDTGTYNCVSSATLYNILGRRLGLELRAVEIPRHVFSVLDDGGKHIDVETTCAAGFDPARNEAARKELKEKKDITYSRERPDDAREVGELGLAAIISYNQGVHLLDEKRFAEALVANFRALGIDRQSPSAAQNATAAFAKWAEAFSGEGKYADALEVLETGLVLAPKDETFQNNRKATWVHWAEAAMDAGKNEATLKIVQQVVEVDRDRLGYLTQEWAKKAYAKGKEARAKEVLTLLVKQFPNRSEVRDALQGHVHRLVETPRDAGKYEDALGVIEGHSDLLTKEETRDLVRSVYDKWAQSFEKKGDWQGAVDIYAKGLKRIPKDEHLVNNAEAIWDSWAKTYMDKKKDWAGAIAIYEKGLKQFPDSSVFKNNIEYCRHQLKKPASAAAR